MKLLAFDTSTEIASVALMSGELVLTEIIQDRKNQAQSILAVIDGLLKEAQLDISMLDGIVFGQGPGSFTGLRISCSIAQGLAYAHNIPLYPVSTLYAIAHSVKNLYMDKPVLTILDARMNEWYWAFYSDLLKTSEYVTSTEDILIPDESYIMAGVGFERLIESMPKTLEKHCIKTVIVYPEALTMIQLVRTGEIESTSFAHAQPVYVRNTVTQGERHG